MEWLQAPPEARVVLPESPMVDVMGGAARWEIKIHEHGFVSLVDVMPRLVPAGRSADWAMVQGARVSTGQGTKSASEDRALIRYMSRNRHTSPTEQTEFKFHCAMPIFIARQWIRHRTAHVNEFSGRYSVMPDRFYRPSIDNVRRQSNLNKQGGEQLVDDLTAEDFLSYLTECEDHYRDYQALLAKGVARELARIGLPLSLYTEWYWKIDCHNLFHFLGLRMESHAQQEIRDYANAMFALIRPIVPVSCEAFLDYHFEAVTLSRLEVEAMRTGQPLQTDNKRELAEWLEKRKLLGLP